MSPKSTDTDLNRSAEASIVFTANLDCEECDETIPDVHFDTGKTDEDGLTDLDPGDLTTEVTCPHCDAIQEVQYPGWVQYGDAG